MSRYKRWKNNNLNNRGIGQQHRHKNNNTNTTNINNNFMNLRGPKRRTSRKAWLCRATWCTAQHSQDCPGVGKLGENRRKKRGISKKQREELWDSLGCAELRCAQHSIAKNVSLVLKGICTTITRTRTTTTTTRKKPERPKEQNCEAILTMLSRQVHRILTSHVNILQLWIAQSYFHFVWPYQHSSFVN